MPHCLIVVYFLNHIFTTIWEANVNYLKENFYYIELDNMNNGKGFLKNSNLLMKWNVKYMSMSFRQWSKNVWIVSILLKVKWLSNIIIFFCWMDSTKMKENFIDNIALHSWLKQVLEMQIKYTD